MVQVQTFVLDYDFAYSAKSNEAKSFRIAAIIAKDQKSYLQSAALPEIYIFILWPEML